ncbi:MAG: DUF4115 domain-containing protein [Candidatus Omnitrophica bacterium]|nr:DUF4115 domain-containing protein [Candidatus Omnitrophota bacterium]
MSLSVGERLKSAREAKGIVLEEAVRVTKIQRRTLEAIEEDRLGETLDPAYAKIFLKKYAAYLGVDGGALVEEYLSAHAAVPEPQQVLGAAARRETKPAPADLRPLFAGAGAGLAALVGIGFLVYLSMDLVRNMKESREIPGAPARVEAQQKPASRPLLVPLSKKLQLTIAASDNVWLQVKADGSIIFQNVLPKGSKESWSAQKELELWTGNASAMALTLNGKALEGVGRGVKKGIKITHAGIEF